MPQPGNEETVGLVDTYEKTMLKLNLENLYVEHRHGAGDQYERILGGNPVRYNGG